MAPELSTHLSNLIGISAYQIAIIISALFIIASFMGAFIATQSTTIALIVSCITSAITAALGFTPWWVVALFVCISIFYLGFYSVSGEPSTESSEGESYWVAYGRKLKLAYASKFGGENLGFNEEVDRRIAIMENNGVGFTRAIAKDWLNRMHKFTEAK